MSEMALELIARAKRERWKRLDLGNCGIVGAVPEEVGELEDLEELILSDRWWEEIEEVRSDLSRVWNSGAGNQITSITTLPSGLKTLVAAGLPLNSLDKFPEIPTLKRIDISSTKIRSLRPLEFYLKKRLNVQPFRAYGIGSLGDYFDPNSQNIDLKRLNWPIKWFPSNGIIVDGCYSLQDPPSEFIRGGRSSIVNWWKERDRVGILPAQDVKIFLLGNSTSGKSTLAHGIATNRLAEEMSSTIGANLQTKIQMDEVTISIWDFGGQEYFHATHRLLMNDDAIYVVVADPFLNKGGYHRTLIRYSDEGQSTEEDLEHFPHRYWLETIRTRTRRSWVMVAWNKLDQENCPQYGLSDADKSLFDHNIQEYPMSLIGALGKKDPAWQNKWQVFKMTYNKKSPRRSTTNR